MREQVIQFFATFFYTGKLFRRRSFAEAFGLVRKTMCSVHQQNNAFLKIRENVRYCTLPQSKNSSKCYTFWAWAGKHFRWLLAKYLSLSLYLSVPVA
jgi:hypothetical protein